MESAIASLADRSGCGPVDDRCAVDVSDDSTLLDAIEERRKLWFGAPWNAARDERSALQRKHPCDSGGLVAAPELLQRGECVLYVDRCPECGSNAARCGAKARIGGNWQ